MYDFYCVLVFTVFLYSDFISKDKIRCLCKRSIKCPYKNYSKENQRKYLIQYDNNGCNLLNLYNWFAKLTKDMNAWGRATK